MNKKLDEFKKQYISQPIPKDLDVRTKQALFKGIARNQRKNSKYKIAIASLSSVACIFLFILIINVNPVFADRLESIPFIGNLVKLTRFEHVEINKPELIADVKIPNIEGLSDKEYEKLINQQLAKEGKSFLSNAQKKSENKVDGEIPVIIASDYEVLSTEKVFSFKIITNEINASSYEHETFYNIDLEKNQRIALKDLFMSGANYIEPINLVIQAQIEEQLNADPIIPYFTDIDKFESIKSNQSFYINKHGKLVIAFNKYEIGPGYLGTPEFIIPTESLKDILKERSPLK